MISITKNVIHTYPSSLVSLAFYNFKVFTYNGNIPVLFKPFFNCYIMASNNK